MKHATSKALENLESLLILIRTFGRLTEKKPGVFYSRSRAFLHFHEDPTGMYADVRPENSWLRVKVDSEEGQQELLSIIRHTFSR